MRVNKLKLSILLFTITFGIFAQQQWGTGFNSKDTINIIDATGKKQGKWIIYGYKKPNTCYKSDQKVEEGFYKDNKKTGVWIEYYCSNNQIKSKITFTDGMPDGPAFMFFENGKIAEEGTWFKNRWIGKYKLYKPDGSFKEYFFDDKGNKKEISSSPK